MDQYKNLKRSGVLVGPNFTTWKARLISLLLVRCLDIRLLEEQNVRSTDEAATKKSQELYSIASIIEIMVDPQLLCRVPSSERVDPQLLMARLETMSTLFRFVDSPAELRNQIYGFYLAHHERMVIKPGSRTSTAYPSITKVSQQLRAEVLPLFYSATTFEFSYRTPAPRLAMHVSRWMSTVIKDRLKQLRSVSVRLRMKKTGAFKTTYCYEEIRLTTDGKHGLRVHYPEKLMPEDKAVLDAYINTAVKMDGQKDGRALVLALLTLEQTLKDTRFRTKA